MSPGWCKCLFGSMLKIRALIMHSQNLSTTALSPPTKMSSNNVTNLVPILNGTNYHQWAELRKAYLQQQGAWIMISAIAGIPPTTLNAEGTNRNNVFEWEQMEAKAQGSIRLHLNVEVSRTMQDKTMANSLWDMLKEVYGSTSAMGAFSSLKAAVGIRLPQSKHPAATIAKINGNLNKLSNAGITLPKEL